MKTKNKILFTVVNISVSFFVYWLLEQGGVLFPFIIGCVLAVFDGAVLDLAEEGG